MDFIDELRQLATRAEKLVEQVHTEEATKHALILPFLQLLGYNIFDPTEVVPEFTADVGAKKGEKVDYAILVDGAPVILIEAKAATAPLVVEAETQLYRYFTATGARFAILTNGVRYKFFSDLTEPNKMDREPFLEFDLMEIKEPVVAELKKFCRASLNVKELSETAVVLKYENRLRKMLEKELREPSDDFLRFWVERIYEGKITAKVLERFRPIVTRSLTQHVNELISETIRSAITSKAPADGQEAEAGQESGESKGGAEDDKGVETTLEELEAFFIVKSILRKQVDPNRIGYKDTVSRFNIMLDGKATRWVCRLRLRPRRKVLLLRGDDGSEEAVALSSVDDLYRYEDRLLAIAARLSA